MHLFEMLETCGLLMLLVKIGKGDVFAVDLYMYT